MEAESDDEMKAESEEEMKDGSDENSSSEERKKKGKIKERGLFGYNPIIEWSVILVVLLIIFNYSSSSEE